MGWPECPQNHRRYPVAHRAHTHTHTHTQRERGTHTHFLAAILYVSQDNPTGPLPQPLGHSLPFTWGQTTHTYTHIPTHTHSHAKDRGKEARRSRIRERRKRRGGSFTPVKKVLCAKECCTEESGGVRGETGATVSATGCIPPPAMPLSLPLSPSSRVKCALEKTKSLVSFLK